MTIVFRRSADPNSEHVVREADFKKNYWADAIGMIQWHAGRPPRYVPQNVANNDLTLDEMTAVLAQLRLRCGGERGVRDAEYRAALRTNGVAPPIGTILNYAFKGGRWFVELDEGWFAYRDDGTWDRFVGAV